MTETVLNSSAALERRSKFLNVRWLVLVWMTVDVAAHYVPTLPFILTAAAVLLVYLASQISALYLSRDFYDSLRSGEVMFIFDLGMILLVLWLMGQMGSALIMAIFLALFIAAVGQRLVFTLLTAVVVSGVFLALKTYTPEGFDVVNLQDLLDLPFILIMSLHAGVLVDETQVEIIRRKLLEASRNTLSSQIEKQRDELYAMIQLTDSLLNALPLAVFMTDRSGVIRYFNRKAESVFHLRKRDVEGRTLSAFEPLAPFQRAMELALLNPVGAQDVDYDKAGYDYAWVRYRVFPVDDRTGQTLGSLCLVFPMSEQGPELPIPKDPKPIK